MMRRILPLTMVWLAAAVLGFCSSTRLFPSSMAVLALAAALTGPRLAIGARKLPALMLVLAMLFFLKRVFLPLESRAMILTASLSYATFHAIAQFCLTAQAGLLFVRIRTRGQDVRTLLIGFLGVGCIGAASACAAPSAQHHTFDVIYAVYTVQLALYLWTPSAIRDESRSWPRLRPVVAVSVLVLALIAGIAAARAIKQHAHTFDTALANVIMSPESAVRVGQVRGASLDAVNRAKDLRGMTPILFAECHQAPGYLRSQAFESFDGRVWTTTIEPVRLKPAIGVSAGLEAPHGMTWFPLREDAPAPDRFITVWLAAAAQGMVYLPLDAAWLATNGTPARTREGIVGLSGDASGHYMTGAKAEQGPEPGALPLPIHTQVPNQVDPRVRKLARSLTGDADSPAERIRAVLDYFHNNYEYSLEFAAPRDDDPLTHFLLEQKPAHCEYFASGAALLLRLSGVPCRYVTGVVADERNPATGSWLARGKDAHAWVEVFEPGRGWRLAEPTPGGPNTGGAAVSPWRQAADTVNLYWRKLSAWLQSAMQAGLKGLLSALGGLLVSTWLGRAVLAAAALAAVLRWGKLLLRLPPVAKEDTHPQFHKLLRSMDRHLRSRGFSREPNETLHQFAARLEPAAPKAAAWYRDYASLRYQNRGGEADTGHLAGTLADLVHKRARPA